ncbi:MAG TPA: hypothetical protein VJZ94_00325, partial [Candidatus Paceibacterota bacterium]|nr:hypothetical protein [Candidatus Paceibacterota bacterium]
MARSFCCRYRVYLSPDLLQKQLTRARKTLRYRTTTTMSIQIHAVTDAKPVRQFNPRRPSARQS